MGWLVKMQKKCHCSIFFLRFFLRNCQLKMSSGNLVLNRKLFNTELWWILLRHKIWAKYVPICKCRPCNRDLSWEQGEDWERFIIPCHFLSQVAFFFLPQHIIYKLIKKTAAFKNPTPASDLNIITILLHKSTKSFGWNVM